MMLRSVRGICVHTQMCTYFCTDSHSSGIMILKQITKLVFSRDCWTKEGVVAVGLGVGSSEATAFWTKDCSVPAPPPLESPMGSLNLNHPQSGQK